MLHIKLTRRYRTKSITRRCNCITVTLSSNIVEHELVIGSKRYHADYRTYIRSLKHSDNLREKNSETWSTDGRKPLTAHTHLRSIFIFINRTRQWRHASRSTVRCCYWRSHGYRPRPLCHRSPASLQYRGGYLNEYRTKGTIKQTGPTSKA